MAQIRLRIDTIQTAGPFTTVIAAEEHIDCPSIILPSTSKLLVGLDLFNCVNRAGNDSNLLIVFYVQIMPDDFVMQLHRF